MDGDYAHGQHTTPANKTSQIRRPGRDFPENTELGSRYTEVNVTRAVFLKISNPAWARIPVIYDKRFPAVDVLYAQSVREGKSHQIPEY